MRVLVNTPGGKVGSQLCTMLLDSGHQLSVIARNPRTVNELSARGARVIEGQTQDPAAAARALEGVDSVFWVCPPRYDSDDLRAFYRECASALAAALSSEGPRRVVSLSSVGANLDAGTGPVAGLHDMEQLISAAASDVTHLRPTYFMENFFMSLPGIISFGKVFFPVAAGVSIPMIATCDIAAAASQRLADTNWSGQHVMDLLGPVDMSFGDATAVLGRSLDLELEYVQTSFEQTKEALLGMGMSNNAASLFVELYRWFDSGMAGHNARRTPQSSTPTSFEHFARESFLPAYRGALQQQNRHG